MIEHETKDPELAETLYLSLYAKANETRANDDLEEARTTYNQAHFELNETSEDRENQWRRCASLDMVARCETDLQYPASEVIKTMSRYATQIEKIYCSVYPGRSFEAPLNPRSVSEIKDFIKFIQEIPDTLPDSLDDDLIQKNWLLYYYISRWAFVMGIYFGRCTSQMDLVNQCRILSEYAATKAHEWRENTGETVQDARFVLKEEVIEHKKGIKDRIFDILGFVIDFENESIQLKQDAFIQKLAGVQDWADAHTHIQVIHKLMTQGDYEEAAKALIKLEEKIEKMQYTDQMGKEFETQLKAKRYFSQACANESNYQDSITGLRVLYFTSVTQFPKIAKEIKILEARAALRYSKLDDALAAFQIAKIMIGNVYEDQNGISDGWLDLVESQISLLRHNNPETLETEVASIGESVKDKIFLACSKLSDLCPDYIKSKVQDSFNKFFVLDDIELLKLDDIKSKFKAYTIEDSIINRPRAEYLPIEAQRLFVLGMVEIEQIRDKYDHQKYLNAVAYLLNAYSILLELDSKDQHLLQQIEDSYKELLRINYTNSRFSEEQIEVILDSLNMKEVGKRNQLEQWTKALLKIISEQKLTSREDCEDDFSTTLARVIPGFVPSASNIHLMKQNELPDWNLKSNEEYSVIQEGTVEKDRETVFITKLSLNTHDEFNDEDHTIVIESAHELTKYTKGSLMMIATALEKALKIHSLYKNSNDGVVEDKERLYDLSAPLTDTLLDEATIEHRKRIQEFIRTFGNEWNREQKGTLNMSFDTDLLVNVARHHDTGKSGSPLIVLLKPGALNNQEFETIKQHPVGGAETLYGLLRFDEVVKLELLHHTQEGSRKGYPWDRKGRKYQEEINGLIARDFDLLTDDERAKLENSTETLQGKRNRDMIMTFDIIEALNAKSRAYRDKLSPKQLIGFAVSNIGINFPHYMVHAFVRYVNKGIFNELISHGEIPNGVRNEFELPVSYKLDDVIEYLKSIDDQQFFDMYKIEHESGVRGLSAGAGCGVAISKEGIRAEMFGMYMRTFKISAKETNDEYGKHCDGFVEEFERWANANGKHSVDDYYGANGYSDKDVQDASEDDHNSVSGIIGLSK